MNHRKSKIILIVLSLVLGLAALQVPLTHLAGSKISFSLFDSFAPALGGIVGTLGGAIVVLAVEVANLVIHGAAPLGWIGLVHLLPPVAATIYFSQKSRFNYFVPVAAILVFITSPTGHQVWYYSLYWLIPAVANFWHRKLWARSLGASFFAHAAGGAFWVYLVPLPKAVWVGLIPIVAGERLLFAAGIAVSSFALANILRALKNHAPALTKTAHELHSH